MNVCIRQADCFVGCQYGARAVQPVFRFLQEDTDDRFTLKRCRVALHPRCACANEVAPPPLSIAPPPPAAFTSEWNLVQHEATRDSSLGSVTALVQRLVNGRSLDLSLRSGSMNLFQCPGDDDGRDTCARHCAVNHLSRCAFRAHACACVILTRVGLCSQTPSIHRDGRAVPSASPLAGAALGAGAVAPALRGRNGRALQPVPEHVRGDRRGGDVLPRRRAGVVLARALRVRHAGARERRAI